jgi:hypothetical protein
VDVLPIVDISDTTMAASGTTKKITSNQILGAGGTATLASATISGDLTVRTNQLVVNSTGVGVGATPSAWSGIGPALQVEQASLLSEASNQLYLTANGYFDGGQWNYINNASADQYYQIAGSHVWRNGTGGAGGTAIGWSTLMTLNSTGLGVGASSPAYKLDVRTAPATAAIEGSRVYDGTRNFIIGQTGATYSYIGIGANQNAIYTSNSRLDIAADGQSIFLRSSATNYLNLDASGNVGIGVTPKSWLSSYRAIQLGYSTSLSSTTGTDFAGLSSNAYVDSVDSRWERIVSGYATQYYQNAGDGQHIWRIAGTAAADTAITWTNAMTLDASGRLILLASTTTPATLTTNGELTMTATSNTNLRFSYRGSDGTTRVANITLA